jgi:hypothetical protein
MTRIEGAEALSSGRLWRSARTVRRDRRRRLDLHDRCEFQPDRDRQPFKDACGFWRRAADGSASKTDRAMRRCS